MNQDVTFSWLCDFVVVALNGSGKEICRIDFSEVTRQHPRERILRGKGENTRNYIYMYDIQGEVSIATQEDIVRSVENYFKTHDLASFDLSELWWELSYEHQCEHLYAWDCQFD